MSIIYDHAQYVNITNKIIDTIKKNGIPFYVKKWKIPIIPSKFDSYDDFFRFVTGLCMEYNNHTFPLSQTINIIKNKNNKNIQFDRPYPKFKYDMKNKIGTIIFYHFYGYGNKQVEKDTRAIIKLVRTNYKKFIKLGLFGLIIDLRKHFGGNMWPCVNSLIDIYGNTTLLSFNNTKTKISDNKWINVINNKIMYEQKFLANKLAFGGPIAIIVSNKTMSSGELITATFMGKPNVKIFGDKTNKTGGYFSINNIFKINNDIDLAVTVSFPTTSDGIFHKNNYIMLDHTSHKPISDAKKWILSHISI